MSDMMDDNAWTRHNGGTFTWGSRFRVGWLDPRYTFSANVPDHHEAAISCVAPNAWVVYIKGTHRAQVESWEEAKGLASVLYGLEVT